MDLGIGLPNTVPGAESAQLTDFARAADDAGFSSLGTIDRIVYPNFEALVCLGAAAAVTKRIKLLTNVVLGPLRMNAALLAKQSLTIDALAGGGRFVLGLGIGGREDDYEVSQVPLSGRGAWMDAALPEIRRIWNGEGNLQSKVGPPAQNGGPSLLLGGSVDASFQRVAKYADGWIMPGGTPDQHTESYESVQSAWQGEGRDGKPKMVGLAYFSLGGDAEANAESYLRNYYAWLGDETAGMVAGGAAKDADTVKQYLSAFEDAGYDELILAPCSSDPAQVGLLAEAAGL
jgi:alkanesulfonate monooxygenase SsuD/methylene tetrahydromethanopterin reductase-like flavin-dependent oxidoreductase (luciferase family)